MHIVWVNQNMLFSSYDVDKARQIISDIRPVKICLPTDRYRVEEGSEDFLI